MHDHETAQSPTREEAPSTQEETVPTPNLDAVRDLILRAHPNAIPELVTGESDEEMLGSVQSAEAAYQRVKDRMTLEPAPPPVPAGGDQPVPVDPERLPPGEKIRRGLASKP